MERVKKLKLILPRCYDRKEDQGDKLVLPVLNLPTIAALTPPRYAVSIVDDRVEKIDFDEPVDLVGITCITETAGRAYDISDEFRRRGVPVILGGIHPTLMTEDALQHADSVFCGEVFGVWEAVLEDFERGMLQKVYRNMQPLDLTGIPHPRFELLRARSRYLSGVRLISATRGCHMRCTFCSTQEFWEGTFRCRPVSEVVAEIASGPERIIAFVDDDIGGNKKYARELFEVLIPLKICWVSQTRINLCMDNDLLALAGRSGCIALFTGFESVSTETLRAAKKYQNVVTNYHRAIDNCHRNGICLEAGFVFGFDTDTRETFQETLQFILASELDSININVLHPIPGTPAFQHMRDEGRITAFDWNDWAAHERCVYTPKQMTAEEVEAGSAWVLKQIYTWPRILRRLLRTLRWGRGRAAFYMFLQNWSYKSRRADQWGGGYNPAGIGRPAGRSSGGETSSANRRGGRRLPLA